ncbi:hypothetical protein Agabi119p4_5444 [Agaricus bisporus var. burnettii]|uniref:Uncharacterized protein n=1 Tax=Agaricus bisporus var. burnettii TaxID=192524 RepID=A0A8H7KGE2_AGABI|nr:hypothetical protein Agabi119p4_5444 [Agaricus bisporus var. burnettii]
MPVPCRFSQEHPNELCLCSACHLSSELFPRRQDGKIVLPGLPASRDSSPSLRAEFRTATTQCDAQELIQGGFRLPPAAGSGQMPAVHSLVQATASISTECGNRRHVQSNKRTETSFGRFENAVAGTGFHGSEGPSGIPECPMRSPTSNYRTRPCSHSQPFHTTTTTVSNPYPTAVDTSYPRPSGKSCLDDRERVSASESTSMPPPSTSNLVNKNHATPVLKFCPPFVASDRIAFPASSDAAKEGVTMIPWSARRRKQKYRSGFDSGTGQGKSKTMFRYYGPDSCSSHDSDM